MEQADFASEVGQARTRLQQLQEAVTSDRPSSADVQAVLQELSSAVEGLEVARVELEVQTDELSSARETLDIERLRYESLFMDAPDAYLITDGVGVVQQANHRAGELFGLDPQQLLGRPLAALVDADTRRAFRDELSLLELGTTREWEVRFARGRLSPFVVLARVSATPDPDGGTVLRWLLREVSERLETEQAFRRMLQESESESESEAQDEDGSEAEFESEFESDAELAATRDEAESCQRLLTAAATVAGAIDGFDGAGVVVHSPSGRLDAATDDVARALLELERTCQGPIHQVMHSGEPCHLPSLDHAAGMADYGAAARKAGAAAVWAHPLRDDAEPSGVLVAYARDAGAASRDVPDALGELTHLVAAYQEVAESLASARKLTGQLQHALSHRVHIEQAKGALAVHWGTDPRSAFELLRRFCRSRRRRMHDVATELVERLGSGTPLPAASEWEPAESHRGPRQLEIVHTAEGLRLIGEADVAVAPILRQTLTELDANGSVLLDLSELRFVDVRCAAVLVEIAERLPDGEELVLAHVPPATARVLELLGAHQHRRIRMMRRSS